MNYYEHTCKCGCGKQIEIKEFHKWHGIPLYTRGHHLKDRDINKTYFIKGHTPWNKGKKINQLTEEHKNKIREKRSLQIITEEHKNKIGQANKGKKRTKKYIKDKSIQVKQLWQNPEYIKKQMKSRLVSQNKAELSLQDIINSITNSFIFVGDGKEIVGNKCPDFIDKINNKIIELYGDYWHKGQDPKDRINYFKNYGYNTLVIWESELKNKETLKTKLIDFSINKQEVQ